MPDGNDRAPWETAPANPNSQTDTPSLAARTIAKVPPPPSDIALRTMASDLASLHETGGGRPKPITISINIPANLRSPDSTSKIPGTAAASKSSAQSIIYLVAGIALVIVLTAAALLLLKK